MTFLATVIAVAVGNLGVLAFLCLAAYFTPPEPDPYTDEDIFGRPCLPPEHDDRG